MKFPTLDSRAKIGATDKSALTARRDGRFLDVYQIENAKNKKMLKMKVAPNNLLKTNIKKNDKTPIPMSI